MSRGFLCGQLRLYRPEDDLQKTKTSPPISSHHETLSTRYDLKCQPPHLQLALLKLEKMKVPEQAICEDQECSFFNKIIVSRRHKFDLFICCIQL